MAVFAIVFCALVGGFYGRSALAVEDQVPDQYKVFTAALNAIVSPWFVRSRPAALAMAYNGGSIGGVIFSPLWVAAIGVLGFPLAAALSA